MSNGTIQWSSESSVEWEHLEEWVRGNVQGFIQGILEEEVTEFLGRRKSQRRSVVDGRVGYRNGYGKARKLTLSAGTIEVRRPRVRNAEERFRRLKAPGLMKDIYVGAEYEDGMAVKAIVEEVAA